MSPNPTARNAAPPRRTHTGWSAGLLLFFLFLLLFANIRFNLLHTVPQDRFISYQADSQALADQKIFEVAARGQLDLKRGFLIKSATMEKLRLGAAFPERAPEDGTIYRSQFGLQGLPGALWQSIFRTAPAETVQWLESLMAAGTAAVVVLLLHGLLIRCGPFVTLAAAVPLLFSPTLIYAGRNLYWVLPLIMLPLVATWRLYEARGLNESTLRVAFPLIVTLVLLKCLCGYEYITCLCLAPAVALVAIWASQDFRDTKGFLVHAVFLFGAACVGFAIAMIVHFVFVWWAVGDFQAAIDSILARATQHIAATGSQGAPEKYQHGLVGLVLMIVKYLTMSGIFVGADVAIGDGTYGLLSSAFIGMFFFVILLSVARMRSIREWRLVIGPVLVITAGLLASVSWLVAARGHALNHFHLNSMAFLPLILAFPLALFAVAEAKRDCNGG